MYIIYDVIFMLYGIVYFPYLLLTGRWYAGFAIRFGIFPLQLKEDIRQKTNIWVHAVSVGEVMLLEGFIDRLRKDYPAYQIIVTVTTKTGYTLACERLKTKALVVPSPLDFSFVAEYFVSLIHPKMYIAVETEIWPNLYRRLYQRQIPLAVINGRISDKSYGRYKCIRFLLKKILNQVELWCMASLRDADRIMDLGANPLKVFVTGNIKFDDLPQTVSSSMGNLLNTKDVSWWVAGSTHPGEEEIVLDVYEKIIKDNPQWRLVLAPRHVERAAQIKELVNRRGLKDVIVIDTIGQLRSLYSQASLVFVGKSLCGSGGQNIIEPALYGKAIVIGPRFENFRDIVAAFKEANAIMQVEDVPDFERAVLQLCADSQKREALGIAAKSVVAANQGATKRSLDRLGLFFK